MTNGYNEMKALIKETKKYYFDLLMAIVKETGSEIDFSDLDDNTTLLLKNGMALMDKAFNTFLAMAKRNDETFQKLEIIESKLDVILAHMSQ